MKSISHIRPLILVLTALCLSAMSAAGQSKRRINPVETPATVTQSVNEARNDSARILQARIARSTHYHDEQGRTVYVDTVSGETWIDSTALIPVVKMKYPLWQDASVSLDVWDPIMRAIGQKYGLFSAAVEVSLHNRYKPVFEAGLGQAKSTPSGNNFTYSSPVSPFFRIGLNYNFLYNSSPDYQFFGGVRYGLSSFNYIVENVTVDGSYWGEDAHFNLPKQHSTVGWFELLIGLRVKLWGPISAGWSFKYHTILHESKVRYGQPWYIPGFGSRTAAVTGAFAVTYTFSIDKLNKARAEEVISPDNELQPSTATSTTDATVE
ncbi:MAG: hypothetical protein K2J10_12105 [Muribaculaceae bacterium]|nr:hypothetical protein [Muribaculaceae bacterium]